MKIAAALWSLSPSNRGMRTYLARVLALLTFSLLSGGAISSSVEIAGQKWVTTWARAMTSNYTQKKEKNEEVVRDNYGQPVDTVPVISSSTLRQVARVSIGGDEIRIRLSNYYGLRPLRVDAADIALGSLGTSDLSSIDVHTSHKLTFDGHLYVVVMPGQTVTSDKVAMRVPSLSNVAVSLYFSGTAELGDMHPQNVAQLAFAIGGRALTAASFASRRPTMEKSTLQHIYFLSGVEVKAPASTRGIVAIGASIVDGYRATDMSKPWPAVMATIANGSLGGVPAAVANMGISADEVSADQIGSPTAGASGLKRFEHDVIDQVGVTDVIVLFGGNDINRGTDPAGYPNGASLGDLISSYRMLVDVAHAHHLRIYAGTQTPFAGVSEPGWYTPEKEEVRVGLNNWIRGSGAFDGVIPFANELSGTYTPSPLAAMQKVLPPGIAAICAGPTGLHPNDRGYALMGVLAYNTLFDASRKVMHSCR